jgi:predicted amidohydrolase YtcJ
MKGMTLWAAIAAFQEHNKGSLEPNKAANFIMLNQPLDDKSDFTKNYVLKMWLSGKLEFGM